MLNEIKNIFKNITNFRQLLNEEISENALVDAINKHKIVYIYYAGDKTISPGYRTVHCMTLGYTKVKDKNYLLLRAWEEAGSSDSKKKYFDKKGRSKYGWRLFNVEGITSFLPTGKYFNTDADKMPDGYNPNDSQMRNIIASIQVTTKGDKMQVKNTDSIEQPDVTTQKVDEPESIFKNQREKFQYFSKAGSKQRETSKDEIEHLWSIAKKIKKKSPEKLLVVTDENGDMLLKDIELKDKLPQDAIVGNLKDLYLKLVNPNQNVSNDFFKQAKSSAISDLKKNKAANRTFFKP